MKLEPCPFCGSGVLHKNNPEKMGYTFFVSCGFCDCRGACLPTEQGAVEAWNTRAAAIPDGYVVVPVLLLKRASAAMMEWAAKYGEHNPQWLPPARVAELHAEIESMIAAKEQQ